MKGSLIDRLIADFKFVIRSPRIIAASLIPLIFIIVIKFVIPLLSGILQQNPEGYYSLISITLVSVLPLLSGMVYSVILPVQKLAYEPAVTLSARKNLVAKMAGSAFFCFVALFITVFLTNPVPSEGWLRKTFVVMLYSFQAPFVLMFLSSLAGKRITGRVLIEIYGLILATVPYGLMVHHPWNYLAFFSPLYWISWSWITHSPSESLIYGVISIIITTICILAFVNLYLKKGRESTLNH